MAYPISSSPKTLLSGTYPLIAVVRHGKTDRNAASGASGEQFRGWDNVPLDATGKKEALQIATILAKALKNVRDIYCSDLSRAEETARAIATTTHGKVEVAKELRPWDLGAFTGKDVASNLEQVKDYVLHPGKVIPDGESFQQFIQRFLGYMQDWMADMVKKPTTCVLVSHTRNVQALKAWAANGFPDDLSYDAAVMNDYTNELKTGQWLELAWEQGQWELEQPTDEPAGERLDSEE